MSKLYEESGDAEASLKHFKDHISYKDSVNNISAVQQMANIRTDFEISQKQLEVDLLNQQKRNQRIVVIATIIALILIIGLAIGLFRRNKFIEKTKQLVEIEKDRSDKLLLNILPEGTAKELKDNGKVNPQKFDSVTVMFTDFEAFTKYSQDLTPELLVKSVDYHFSKFDQIIDELKANPNFDKTRIFLATADSRLGMHNEEKADGVLIKPIGLHLLQNLASRYLQASS